VLQANLSETHCTLLPFCWVPLSPESTVLVTSCPQSNLLQGPWVGLLILLCCV
jgi:hypothetical protein